MVLRLQGFVLFLFIPLVLYLFLAQPVHALGALALGVALMFGHRFLAVPFMERTIGRRCLWSGAEIAPGCVYRVVSGGQERTFHFFTDGLREKGARFLTFAQTFAWPLRVLILAPLAYYLVAEVLRLAGVGGVPSHATNSMIFRGVLGFTTLATFIGHRFVTPIPHMKGPVRFPFPIHNVFLLGIFYTLAVFAVVGAWWLVDIALALAG